jgi:ABC-2 family transporter protein
MSISTLFPVARLISRVVEHKETRMAETMKIMGLHEWIYDLSWWLIGCFTFTFIAVGITYMSSTTFLPSSDSSLLLVFFLLFTLGEINFALLISCFFNRAKVSEII